MPEQLPIVVPPGPRPDPRLDPGPRVAPACLWDAVLTARAALEHERHQHRRPAELTARLVLLEALEAYVRSLEERSHPIPYALRDELRLQRLACAARRPFPHDRTGSLHIARGIR